MSEDMPVMSKKASKNIKITLKKSKKLTREEIIDQFRLIRGEDLKKILAKFDKMSKEGQDNFKKMFPGLFEESEIPLDFIKQLENEFYANPTEEMKENIAYFKKVKLERIQKRIAEYKEHYNDPYVYDMGEIDAVRALHSHALMDIEFLLYETERIKNNSLV